MSKKPKPTDNPFYCGMGPHGPLYYTTVEDRIYRIKTIDRDQCEAVLAMDGLQKSVRIAALRRMNQIARQYSESCKN